jgi:hypothetical protein
MDLARSCGRSSESAWSSNACMESSSARPKSGASWGRWA